MVRKEGGVYRSADPFERRRVERVCCAGERPDLEGHLDGALEIPKASEHDLRIVRRSMPA
jgi:hypothetical protein